MGEHDDDARLRVSYGSWCWLSQDETSVMSRRRPPEQGSGAYGTDETEDAFWHTCEYCGRTVRGERQPRERWFDLAHRQITVTVGGYRLCHPCWEVLDVSYRHYVSAGYAVLPEPAGVWWWHNLWWVLEHRVDPATERWEPERSDRLGAVGRSEGNVPWETGIPNNINARLYPPIPIPAGRV